MTDTGSGTIEFPAELLTLYLNHLPATFRVTGSETSTKPGTVLLSVVSAQLVGHGHHLTMRLIDEGMTRRAEVTTSGNPVSSSG